MKNSLYIIIIISGLVCSGIRAYAQEPEDVANSPREKLDLGTVDLGFGVVQDRTTSTASTATIGSDVLEQRAAINVQDAFYGRLLGLTTLRTGGTQGGWVGGQWYGASFNIRGIHSMSETGGLSDMSGLSTNKDQVLILVDGLPRYLDWITPDEIESISVLKDAAAIAMYGYTGLSGIISVKTKRGSASDAGLKVTAKYNHKFTYGADFPEYVNAYTYARAMNEARMNEGLPRTYNDWEVAAFKSGEYPSYYPNVDWKKAALRDMGSEDMFNVTLSNSDDKVRFLTMLNYTNSQGLLADTETNRDRGYSTQLKLSKANIRANLDIKMTRTTTLEASVLGVLQETNRPAGITANGVFGILNSLSAGSFPIRTIDGIWGGAPELHAVGVYNPLAYIQETGYRRELGGVVNTDFKLTQSLEDFVEGLSVSARFGYDSWNIAYENRSRQYAWARDRVSFDSNGNPVPAVDSETGLPTGKMELIRVSGGALQNQLSFGRGANVHQSRSLNAVMSANYDRLFGEHHLAGALVFYLNNYNQDKTDNINTLRTFFRRSVIGHFHYDLSSKYAADVALTYAGSNYSYPKSWAFSPTVSLGWVASNEDFLKDVEFIDLLKLRGSYGRLHSDYVPRYGRMWMDIYDGSSGGFPLADTDGTWGGTAFGVRQQFLSTTDFKLEVANKFNLGLEALLLNSIGLTVEGYYERRSNILMSESGLYVSMLGIIPGFGNHGVVDSKGIEIGLDYHNTFDGLKVNFGGMFTYGVNKIVECVETPKPYEWLELKGKQVGQMFGLEHIGFFKDEADIANSPFQQFSLVRPGDAKYKNRKGDNTINDYDYVPIGYSDIVPEINFAFNAGLEFMGIGMNITFQGAKNFSKWHPYSNPLLQGMNITAEYYENRWVPGLDNSNAKYPALMAAENINNNRTSTLWYLDASFLKLRNCELYYRIPESLLSKLKRGDYHLSDVKLSLRGENLYTWSSFVGLDPEMPWTNYPMLKGVSVGLSITF